MTFNELNIIEPICAALKAKGYTIPTPIQQQAIPSVLEGKDVFGSAQTGTGKTAAFSIPILQHLAANPGKPGAIKALVLAPTRELAMQIGQSFHEYGKNLRITHTVVVGGVSELMQKRAISRGVDILIATPGRLLDLVNQGAVKLNDVKYFVLDEADRMLDMGFIHDIKQIIKRISTQRQTLFFSATIPKEIKELASSLLNNPVHISTAPVSSSSADVEQTVYYVDKTDKRDLLKHILSSSVDHALVFTRTKRGADKVSKDLNAKGIRSEAIHGDKSQGARERALKGFKSRSVKVLVATDIASRGIDIDKLSHVINFEIPECAETYVHRIGRTGRAGAKGTAISFCSHDEKSYLRDIIRLTKKDIKVEKTPVY